MDCEATKGEYERAKNEGWLDGVRDINHYSRETRIVGAWLAFGLRRVLCALFLVPGEADPIHPIEFII